MAKSIHTRDLEGATRVWITSSPNERMWSVCCSVCCSVLQCVAVCRSVSQCVAVCCSVLQCVTVCCSVSRYIAVRCIVLQCVIYPATCKWRIVSLYVLDTSGSWSAACCSSRTCISGDTAVILRSCSRCSTPHMHLCVCLL